MPGLMPIPEIYIQPHSTALSLATTDRTLTSPGSVKETTQAASFSSQEASALVIDRTAVRRPPIALWGPGAPSPAARYPFCRTVLVPPPIHPVEIACPHSVEALRRARDVALHEDMLRPQEIKHLTLRAIKVLGSLALLREIHWHLAQRRVATRMMIPAEVLRHANADKLLFNLLHDIVKATKCQRPELKKFVSHTKICLMTIIETPDIRPRTPNSLEVVAAQHILRLVEAAPADLRGACEAVALVPLTKPGFENITAVALLVHG